MNRLAATRNLKKIHGAFGGGFGGKANKIQLKKKPKRTLICRKVMLSQLVQEVVYKKLEKKRMELEELEREFEMMMETEDPEINQR